MEAFIFFGKMLVMAQPQGYQYEHQPSAEVRIPALER